MNIFQEAYSNMIDEVNKPKQILTDKQIEKLARPFIHSIGDYSYHEDGIRDDGDVEDFARVIEAAILIELDK